MTDTDWRDIGQGHRISFRYSDLRRTALDGTTTSEPILVGLREDHGCRAGAGWIPFANAPEPFAASEHGWTVDNWDLEQFTLSPSLQCTACPDHGYIRDGRWVPA